MSKSILFWVLILLPLSNAIAAERFRAFTRVHRDQGHVSIWSAPLPLKFKTKELEKKFLSLKNGQEILISGEMGVVANSSLEAERLMGHLYVDEILIVSLASLGVAPEKIPDKEYYPTQEMAYQPGVLKIPETVANTILLTSSMMLFKSLSDASQTAPVKDKINTNLILGSGLLALGIFVWDAQ